MTLHSKGVRDMVLILALVGWLGPLAGALRADIQSTQSSQGAHKARKGSEKITVATQSFPRILAPPGGVPVLRGGSVDVPIVMPSRTGGGFEITPKDTPLHGHLQRLDNEVGAPIRYRYLHHRSSSEFEDTFSLLVRDRLSNESGTLVKVRILVRNPKPDLVVDPSGEIPFGKIPIGTASTNEVALINRFGSSLQGTLHVSKPWRILGDPEINLEEGSSRTVLLAFAPEAEGEQSSLLTIEPPVDQFPEIRLSGAGLPTFLYLGPSVLEATADNPEMALVLSNTTGSHVPVRINGMPQELSSPGVLDLSPHGTGTLSVSASRLKIPPEGSRKFRLSLASGTYVSNVDLIVKGRRADPLLELLHPDATAAPIGSALVLEGIVRNPSEVQRPVEITLRDRESPDVILAKVTEILPPGKPVPFRINWAPSVPGTHELHVELSEQGRLLDRQSRIVNALAREQPRTGTRVGTHSRIHPSGKNPDLPPKGFQVRASSNEEREKIILDLHPILEPGILFNRICLRWRYYGTSTSGFVLETLNHRNNLSDRTGMPDGETWTRLSGVCPSFEQGSWNADLGLVWPGSHQYRVYPAGMDQVMVATLTLDVSKWVFFGPLFRDLLIILLLLGIFKFIRLKNWI